MHLSLRAAWRLAAVVFLAVCALALVHVRRTRLQHAPTAERSIRAASPIRDLAATAPLNQPGGGDAPAEAYAVYSDLYQASMGEPLAFAEDSWTDLPQVGESCLKPLTGEEREMASAFAEANRQSHRWGQKFAIAQGYRLFSKAETSQALECLSPAKRGEAQCARYAQLKYVRLLGVPGFDRAHTRALVSVIKKCGGFCGSGGVFEVEKVNGTWRRSAAADFTRNCSWMY